MPITFSPSRATRARCARMSSCSPPSRRRMASAIPRSPDIKPSMAITAIETRTYTVIHDVAWLQERHQWPGLQGVVMVESERQIPGPSPQTDKFERETRFYITSLLWVAAQLGPAVRAHWMVENGLHWVMDVTFRDDQCRIRTDHAPANFTTIKHMALNLIRRARGKDSL